MKLTKAQRRMLENVRDTGLAFASATDARTYASASRTAKVLMAKALMVQDPEDSTWSLTKAGAKALGSTS